MQSNINQLNLPFPVNHKEIQEKLDILSKELNLKITEIDHEIWEIRIIRENT
jgi:hypothetical protein